jgi:hypothetical protein
MCKTKHKRMLHPACNKEHAQQTHTKTRHTQKTVGVVRWVGVWVWAWASGNELRKVEDKQTRRGEENGDGKA